MADLSGVLRKTIDGLPRATPQMRAKVYDKARAAIQRQIDAANPPLAENVVATRLAALEDAIERTEQHYAGQEAATSADDLDSLLAAGAPEPRDTSFAGNADEPAPDAWVGASESAMPAASPSRAGLPRAPSLPTQPPEQGDAPADSRPESNERSDAPGDNGAFGSVFSGLKKSSAAPRSEPPPFFPITTEEPDDAVRPSSVDAPFIVPSASDGGHRDDAGPHQENFDDDDEERIPAGIRIDDEIPEADVSAPSYSPRRKKPGTGKGRSLIAALFVVVLLGGLGTVGWAYRDQIEALLVAPSSDLDNVAVSAGNKEAVASAEPEGAGVADGGTSPASEKPGQASSGGADTGTTDAASAEARRSSSTRQFTQRLLPDGTEVDEGPAAGEPNAFDEGTDIAAASLIPSDSPASSTPTISSEIGENPAVVGAAPAEAETPADAEKADTPEVAAIDPETNATPAVAQQAVFYQERTQTASGTQESGNVVWSVVDEPPSEGQPPEPAIRAVADIPDENLKMTMTIRRNADPTLPASHVIELLFDTPPNFSGGGVANVQRLALKATEQARGEPLIGVAGKISDGFFIIALNNLEQVTQSNLSLLESEQWIDIPIAYETGRRALMSIEKGIPGDRVFKEALDAWETKT